MRNRTAIALVLGLALAPSGCADPGGGTPLPLVWEPPKNPHLADSAWAIYHHDNYAQHFSTLPGVEGRGRVDVTTVPLDGIPIFVLFDPSEDILTVAKGLSGVTLWKIDRETLQPVARADLPLFGVFSGMYGYVDAQGRSVLGIGRQILRYRPEANSIEPDGAADLSGVLPDDDVLVSISVLYTGEIVFLSEQGVFGVLAADLAGPPLATLQLPEPDASNGFSVDETGGVYIVTGRAILRVDWDGQTLATAWSQPVDAPFATPRPGRLGIGSGTTPALMLDSYVVIADDAERMNLIVLDRHDGRTICKEPVFDEPAATDNAIVVAGRTMIVEQNLQGGRGVARFDLEEDGTCRRVWVSPVAAPTCVPTLSTASNLVYVYTVEDEEWALEGLDVETGATVFRAPTGRGGLYDNYYAAVTIGPDRRVYVGALVGLQVFQDAP